MANTVVHNGYPFRRIQLPHEGQAPIRFDTASGLPSHYSYFSNILHAPPRGPVVAIITVLSILLTNKGFQSDSFGAPTTLGPKFRSIRFFEILIIHFTIGFFTFFVVKFGTFPNLNNVHYISFVFTVNILLLLYFHRFRDTHTTFDEFTERIMYTYHSNPPSKESD